MSDASIMNSLLEGMICQGSSPTHSHLVFPSSTLCLTAKCKNIYSTASN